MNIERLNVLLVDDEPHVLDGLRRQLRAHREKWDMRFAGSAEIALEMMKEHPAEIIVSDMRMSGTSGGQLLQQVRQLYPQTTRVILSGQTDQDSLMQDLGCIHQYLQKPCDAAVLCAAIERTHLLYGSLQQPALRMAANRIISLPPGNAIYESLVDELSKPDADIRRVGEIVACDPALTVKLLQLVNSAFFGAPRKINSAQDAVVRLGLKTIHAVVVAGRIFDFLADADQRQMITALWTASLQIGESAGRFAAAAGTTAVVQQEARLAGILCLIGRAILLTSQPALYFQALEASTAGNVPLDQCERQVFGATQDQVGAFALGQWAFADEIVDAVAWQCIPSMGSGIVRSRPLPYLHLARCSHTSCARGLDPRPQPDWAFIDRNDLATHLSQLERPAA